MRAALLPAVVLAAVAAFCVGFPLEDVTSTADISAVDEAVSWDPLDLGSVNDLGAAKESDVIPMTASKAKVEKADKQAASSMALVPPSYSLDEKRRIARARVTPIAKFYNGSLENITKAGKGEDMVTEYMEATRMMKVDKDLARIRGNNATKVYSKTNNPILKAHYNKEYQMITDMNNATEIAWREKWNIEAAQIRMSHAVLCKNLTAPGGNPYPKGSAQYKGILAACKMEKPENLNNITAMPQGSHDVIRGPYVDEEHPNATEVQSVNTALANASDSTAMELDSLEVDLEI